MDINNKGFFEQTNQEQGEPVAIPDCGEAGHDDGCCGNAQCLPSARRLKLPDYTQSAKQEQGEPVAVVTGVYGGRFTYAPFKSAVILPVGMALYSSPQQRTWVGLTLTEQADCYAGTETENEFYLAVEAKLKEKNT